MTEFESHPCIVVESVQVGAHQLEALVHVTDPALMRTSAVPSLAHDALSLLPGLRRHTCENDAGLHFGAELADTESAHLLEHVTVELMALAGSPRSLRAETRWDFSADGRGRFRLSLDYDDDLVALGALKEAVLVVDWLLLGEPPGNSDVRRPRRPDIQAITTRLQGLRRR